MDKLTADIVKAGEDYNKKEAGRIIREKEERKYNSILIIGGIILALLLLYGYDKNKEIEMDKKVKSICNVILQQQPNNWTLYDACYDESMAQFGGDMTVPPSTGD